MFQNFLPLIAALVPPTALFAYNDVSGALDQLATGAVSVIGVFLIFAVALEVQTEGVGDAETRRFVMFLVGMGVACFAMCVLIGAMYTLGTLLPEHMFYLRADGKTLVIDPQAARYESVKFCIMASLIYVAGFTTAWICRRRAKKLSSITPRPRGRRH